VKKAKQTYKQNHAIDGNGSKVERQLLRHASIAEQGERSNVTM
jgi:hypothetical protein